MHGIPFQIDHGVTVQKSDTICAIKVHMEENSRLIALVKMHQTMPHIREVELSKLMDSEPQLVDAVCYFSQKLVASSGNRNITVTILQDLLWTILGTLWDNDILVRKRDIVVKNDDPMQGSVTASRASTAGELLSKEKQLKNAIETIKTLKAEVARLSKLPKSKARAGEGEEAIARRRSTLALTSRDPMPVEETVVPVTIEEGTEVAEAVMSVSNNIDAVFDDTVAVERGVLSLDQFSLMLEAEETPDMGAQVESTNTDPLPPNNLQAELDAVRIQMRLLEAENRRLKSDAMSAPSTAPATADIGDRRSSHLSFRPVATPTIAEQETVNVDTDYRSPVMSPTRVALIRKRSSLAIESVLGSPRAEVLEDISHRSSKNSSKSTARVEAMMREEVTLMKQREAEDEVRINELLRELIEKDEMIATLSREVDRGHIVRDPHEEVPASARVAVIMDERMSELTEMRVQNEQLKVIMAALDAERNSLIERVDILQQSAPPAVAISRRQSRAATISEMVETEPTVSSRVTPSLSGANMVDSPTQTLTILPILSVVKLSGIEVISEAVEPMGREEIEAQLEAEKANTANAIAETQRVKVCLSELERQLASMQFQLRKSGVKHEHIVQAMAHSGLTQFMRANRTGVFERLYQDALNRMIKMEKIREKVRIIESKEYMRKEQVASWSAANVYEFKWDSAARAVTSHTGAHLTSFSRWKHRGEKARTLSLVPERFLITTPLLSPLLGHRRML